MDFIKILIIEDEVLIADYIKETLEINRFKNIHMAHSVSEAREKMHILQPDIILMDINLEGHFEGIQLGREKSSETAIIYITGQSDSRMIEEALDSSPDSYLTKPIREVELIAALKIIINKKQKEYLFVKDGYDDIKLKLQDIIYVEVDKNYLDIYLTDRKVTVRKTLQEFCRQLPISFKQIHRSIIVNTGLIEKITSDEVWIKDLRLPVSRNFRANL
ncbi:LytR/AlgR family response regulator transcription factor [Epilithonimonas xixisoli]|uniref:LytTR family two component transcriptional regulator n=1 Tax=Epilithonimonas xixisoli TaxID=1476462 RepID=A0A4R8II52_9FLAO|nr:response regulator transcription factor [Epilithonimonas xixisoli]TDX86583.1 LytTR family two component transcriptional regulator [Epilithonimonas xixisoli]